MKEITYTPWTDGYAVGFKYQKATGETGYIYLNPSSEDSEGEPNVFLYHGPSGNPCNDSALTHVVV